MSDPQPNQRRDRIALWIARAFLWPVARLRPSSGWAKIYQRLTELHRSSEYNPPKESKAKKQPWSPALMLFVALISVALAVWVFDAIRKRFPGHSSNPPSVISTISYEILPTKIV